MRTKKKELERLNRLMEVGSLKKVKLATNQKQNEEVEEMKANYIPNMEEEVDGDDEEDQNNLNYEEDYDDEFENEVVINENEGAEGEEWEDMDNSMQQEDIEEEEEEEKAPVEATKSKKKKKGNMEEQEKELTDLMSKLEFSDKPVVFEPPEKPKKKKKGKDKEIKPFTGNAKSLGKNETLDFDNRAYETFHRATTEWPCLSYDFFAPSAIYGELDSKKLKYPLTLYLVAGTQAEKANQNAIYIMKWEELCKTKNDDDSVDFDSDDSKDDQEPEMHLLSIKQNSCINRIKTMSNSPIVALWNENCEVGLYNCSEYLETLIAYEEDPMTSKRPMLKAPKGNPLIKTFKHNDEGFALEWSPFNNGIFASGSNDKKIYLYRPLSEGFSDWAKDISPYVYHSGSVEDLQFSPRDEALFASCSSDKTLCVVDIRVGNRNQANILIKAHESDVNVMCWNAINPDLIATGADDGSFKVWDLRYYKDAEPIFEMEWHTEPITSIHYQPGQDSVLVVASEDNRISVWDLAMEAEDANEKNDFPDQLLFLHQGQEEVKEVKFHPKFHDLIASTSASGFNVFKPNVDVEEDEEDL